MFSFVIPVLFKAKSLPGEEFRELMTPEVGTVNDAGDSPQNHPKWWRGMSGPI